MKRLLRVSPVLIAIALLAGCAAGRAFSRGEGRAKAGDWDAAVAYYQQAVQKDANNADYRIALERAMLNASHVHFDNARQLEAKDQLDGALLEYRKAAEFDPANRQAADKVVSLDRTIQQRIEASRPRPATAILRDQARLQAAAPALNPASRDPIVANFTQASLRDILTFISNSAGISIVYDQTFADKQFTININGTLEQVLNAILTANQMFYVVQDEHSVLIATDTNVNRLKYERQVIQQFPISYADVTELASLLTTITRTTTAAIVPVIQANKTNNTIDVRATQPVMDVIREFIITNDKPRSEVVLEVEILEVNKAKAKTYGLNLSNYQIGAAFSPEAVPGANTVPFNLNTISQGVSTADFYLTVPTAFVRFLETDTNSKVLLKTNLRGSEGTTLSLNIGAREPYLATTFSAIATGGANVNPTSSYNFEQVGISIAATPRVTDEGDILITPLTLKNSALGPSRQVGGSPAPSFTNREVTTNLRLRDGEPHLLAGLLQDDNNKTMRGFPGIMSIKGLRELLSDTDSNSVQTDIVMLLTPRIIRTHEYTAHDLAPINVGTNQAFGLTGPPPLIAAPPDGEPQPAGTPGAPGALQPPAAVPAPPGGAIPQAQGGVPPVEPPTTLTTLRPPAASAQISLTAPQGDVRVAAGPYTVPVFVSGASRMSTVTLTVNFNPAVLRVRQIAEGSFLKQGGAVTVFTNKIDATLGRIDITVVRTGDSAGASGTGLLSGLMFDAVGAGTSQMSVSGVATDPGGASLPLQFAPLSIVVR